MMIDEETGKEGSDEKWVRIHPDDRVWLEGEVVRLLRERYKETGELRRPNLQDTLGALFAELRSGRKQLDELCERNEWLESRLARCQAHGSPNPPTRDAHEGHQPGLEPDHTTSQSRGQTEARLL